jgi:preprotein translocase subunit SecE
VTTEVSQASEFESSTRRTTSRGRDEKRPPFPARLALYTRQVVSELRKVIWPTRNELVTYTIVSITFVTAMVAYVGLLDYGFTKAIFKMFG